MNMQTVKASLYFPTDMSGKPFITDLVRDYGLTVNILQAEIMPGQRGKSVINLTGTQDALEKGLIYLSENGISVRMFTTNIIHNAEKCVDCGACVAVCMTGALEIGAPEWKLAFDAGKCVRCKQCVKACPTNAINVNVFQ